MTKDGVFRPVLKRQVGIKENRDWVKRADISKKNTGRFFSQLYAHIFGGKVREELWGNGFNTRKNARNFSPDRIRFENGREIDSEDKVTSGRSLQIHSYVKQEENNLYSFLLRANEEDGLPPQMEYTMTKYGTRGLTGLHRLSNGKLVQTLAETKKRLVILPFNAFLYLAHYSRHETRDQETSEHGNNKQKYHVVNGGTTFNALFKNSMRIEDVTEHPIPGLEKLLCLGDIEVEHLETPKIEGHYTSSFVIEPFPVTRYFVPYERYPRLVESIMENHREICLALGLKDAFQEYRELPDIPF